MGNPLRDGRPVSTRDHRSGPAFEQWKLDRAAEIAEEQRQQAEAQAAAEAADPVLVFQKASDAEAQAIRELILTGYVPTELLPGDRVNGRKINEDVAASNFKLWAQQESTFQRYMFETLYAAMKRNDLAPIANNFGTLHRLLLQYAAYPDEPVQEVLPVQSEQSEQPVLTPREASIKKFNDDRTIVVVTDPETGKEYTEHMLSLLDSVTERRLRRIAENRIGSSNFETYLDVKTAQFERDQDIARRAAAEDER